MERMDEPKSNVKELKPCKKGKSIERADRISSLPDAIIHHIFSFLSTIDAVRTSVLARRWRHLWTEAHNLNFDDDLYQIVAKENSFANFVDAVHNLFKSPNIHRYILSLQKPRNTSSVNAWVRFAVQRNVRELYVSMFAQKPFEMPCCGAVKVLKLNLQGELVLPITGCFNSLETLSLSRVQLNDNAIADAISNRCPRLRSLNLKDCIGLIYLNISCPILEELNIERCFGLNQLNVFTERLQILSVQDSFTYASKTNSVVISASGLQTFKWLDYIIDDFHIGNFTSLKVAHISLVFDYYPELEKAYLKNARKFLSHLACAKSLEVEMPCFWGLSMHREMLEGLSTPLHNLKHLTLLVGHDDYIFRGISYLFNSCSYLEILHIHVANEDTQRSLDSQFPDASLFDKRECLNYQLVPVNHLLEVTICGFRGKEHEIEFVKYLLEYAVILKKMFILSSDEAFAGQDMKIEMAQKLEEFKSIYPNTTISFN